MSNSILLTQFTGLPVRNLPKKWINSNVPAFDGIRPIDCAGDSKLTKPLREYLMRVPS